MKVNIKRSNSIAMSGRTTLLVVNDLVVLELLGKKTKTEMIREFAQKKNALELLNISLDEKPRNCSTINELLKLVRPEARVKLVQGRGYVYVTGDDVANCYSQSCNVYHASSMTVAQWLREVDEKLAESKAADLTDEEFALEVHAE